MVFRNRIVFPFSFVFLLFGRGGVVRGHVLLSQLIHIKYEAHGLTY